MASAAVANRIGPPVPPKPVKGSHLAVVGLDLGTTFSGFAFSLVASKKEIRMFKDWGASVGTHHSFKTPTCLLLNSKGDLDSFGYEAQAKLALLTGDDSDNDDDVSNNPANYEFYEGFKMRLYDEKGLTRRICASSQNNKTCSLMKLIMLTLDYLKRKVLETMNNQLANPVDMRDIRWVVTVPAIWGDGAKQFMQEASKQAGLVDPHDPSKFLLALEPEAASVHCKTTQVNCNRDSDDFKMPVGTKYLVVDAGGGTLDMTAQEILAKDQMDMLCCANGGPLGGLRVNENITELLEKVFSKGCLDTHKRECLADYMELMYQIEAKKKVVKLENTSPTINLMISHALASTCIDYHSKPRLADCVSPEMRALGVKIANGALRLPVGLVLEAFTVVTDKIVEDVDKLLMRSEVSGITHIIMVGGFSESLVLKASMKNKFGSKYKVLTPNNAGTAVLQGAVLYGHDPTVINARRAERTYAVDDWPLYDPTIHDESRKVKSDDKTFRVKGGLHILVKKGQVVHRNATHSYYISPVYSKQPDIPVKLYSTNSTEAKYADDPGMEEVANFRVSLPGTGLDRDAELTFKFGGTKVEVEGRDVRGGKVVKTTFSFLTDQ